MEQTLKLIIRSRKNSMFYKTQNGANVANILTSIIATCAQNNVNAYEYLIWVQQNRVSLRASPEQFLPWCFKASTELERCSAA